MIGKESSYGPKTAWLSGFERSDFGTMVQKNIEGTGYAIYQDPYFPKFNLFFRSAALKNRVSIIYPTIPDK